MIYRILIKNIDGSMQYATERIKRKDGNTFFEDFGTKDFNKAKEKFLDLLDLYKITQLKIIGDLEEEINIDIHTKDKT